MALLDNAIWLTGTGGTAADGTTTITDGPNSTIVTGTFTSDTWDADQSGYNVSEFGAFGLTSPASMNYAFSQDVENINFDFNHISDDGASTYDDKWTVYIYDSNGVLVPTADVIAAFTGMVDEVVYANPDGSVSIEAEGTDISDVNFNLVGYQISEMELVLAPGSGGTQTGGTGISDISFSIPTPPDGTIEGTAGADEIDVLYTGDPNGDMVDDNDATLTGHSGNDDLIYGYGGDDRITSGDGQDTAYGGLGRDTLYGGADDDTLYGGTENDLVYGGDGNDRAFGEAGEDYLRGGAGDDTLFGGDSDDDLDGDGGVDAIYGGSGNDNIDGDTGNDALDGGSGNDSVYGGAGDDAIMGGSGNDALYAGAGNDYIDAGSGNDFISLSSGNDEVHAGEDSDNINLAAGNFLDGALLTINGGEDGTDYDTLNMTSWDAYRSLVQTTDPDGDSTSGSVELRDLSGNWVTVNFTEIENLRLPAVNLDPDQTVEGTAGDDIIDTSYLGDPEGDMVDNNDATDGSNDDLIEAYGGNDTAYGGAGNDTVYGGAGNDDVIGEDGDDTLFGGAGEDFLNGVTGNDTLYGGDDNDAIESGAGNDHTYGDAGDDSINGDLGEDNVYGGAGDDYVRGSFGNDTVYGGTGDDYVWGGYGDDIHVVEDDFGNDTYFGDSEDETFGDTLDLSAVTDDLTIDLRDGVPEIGSFTDGTYTATFEEIEHITLGGGTDTLILGDQSGTDVVGGFEAPTLNPDGTYTAGDLLDVSDLTSDYGDTPVNVTDVTVTDDGNGNAVLTFPAGENITLVGVSPSSLDDPLALEAIGIPLNDGVVDGTSGDDLIDTSYLGDPDGDLVDNGDAILPGDVNDDDLIQANAGNDVVHAGTGDDRVFGDVGDDALSGQIGDDTLYGGDGADALYGGAGNDTLYGGDDEDVIFGGGGDSIHGGGGGTDNDTLILGEFGTTITYDNLDPESGTVEFADGSTLTFTDIENVVPCFTPGTLIRTDYGDVPVESLQEGDLVLTRDAGFQPVAWTGKRHVTGAKLKATPALQPILIRQDALGHGQPNRDMFVSPQHRMLVANGDVQLWIGVDEVLVKAKDMTHLIGVETAALPEVTYVHVMFEHHQIILADGAWTESFQPGDMIGESADQEMFAEIFELFPELATAEGRMSYHSARISAKKHEARIIC